MKVRLFIPLLIILANLPAKAQDDRKWAIGFGVSPDLCYRTLSNSTGDPVVDGVINARNESEHFKLGFTAGVHVKRTVSKRLSFETGLLYSNKGYMLRAHLILGDQVDPIRGSDATTRYSYLYADWPLKVNVSIINKEKTSFYVTTGAVFNIFLEQRNVTTINFPDGSKDVRRSTGEPFYTNNPLNISAFAGFGMRRQLGPRIDIQIEPVFRYGMVPLHEAPIEGFLWNYGFNTVLFYKL